MTSPQRFGSTAKIELDEAAERKLRIALARMDSVQERNADANPGEVVERRDHYVVLDGENGPGVWVRSHILIDPGYTESPSAVSQ